MTSGAWLSPKEHEGSGGIRGSGQQGGPGMTDASFLWMETEMISVMG